MCYTLKHKKCLYLVCYIFSKICESKNEKFSGVLGFNCFLFTHYHINIRKPIAVLRLSIYLLFYVIIKGVGFYQPIEKYSREKNSVYVQRVVYVEIYLLRETFTFMKKIYCFKKSKAKQTLYIRTFNVCPTTAAKSGNHSNVINIFPSVLNPLFVN